MPQQKTEKNNKGLTKDQIKEELRTWKTTAKDWETYPLSVRGSSVIKTPKGLMMLVNPVDGKNNSLTRQGTFIRDEVVLDSYLESFKEAEKLKKVAVALEELSNEEKKKHSKVLNIE